MQNVADDSRAMSNSKREKELVPSQFCVPGELFFLKKGHASASFRQVVRCSRACGTSSDDRDVESSGRERSDVDLGGGAVFARHCGAASSPRRRSQGRSADESRRDGRRGV